MHKKRESLWIIKCLFLFIMVNIKYIRSSATTRRSPKTRLNFPLPQNQNEWYFLVFYFLITIVIIIIIIIIVSYMFRSLSFIYILFGTGMVQEIWSCEWCLALISKQSQETSKLNKTRFTINPWVEIQASTEQ